MLGFVSLLMDVSSEMIHALLPVVVPILVGLILGPKALGGLLLGVLLWGLHMGMTQGLLSAMVAAGAPADLRGTAFGFFNLVSGLAMLAASVLASLLWQYLAPAWTFGAGAVFAGAALLALRGDGH